MTGLSCQLPSFGNLWYWNGCCATAMSRWREE
jgi:hypothetical protein